METPSGHLTLKDIAREAGVSVATIDRVLHGRSGVRADTARRVREAIARHDFRPSIAAAELARGRAMKFAFVMPTGSNIFMQMILGHIAEMSGWLAARRTTVETIVTDVFNPEILDANAGIPARSVSMAWRSSRSIIRAFAPPSTTSPPRGLLS